MQQPYSGALNQLCGCFGCTERSPLSEENTASAIGYKISEQCYQASSVTVYGSFFIYLFINLN